MLTFPTYFRRERPVVMAIDREGERLEVSIHPGVPRPEIDLLINLLVALVHAGLAVVAFGHARSDVRARLLTVFALAVALEEVLPFEPLNVVPIGLASAAAFFLLTGLQMGLEVHMALLIPERPAWLERHRLVIPFVYSVGGIVALVAVAALLAENAWGVRLPWTSSQAQFVLIDLGLPIWAALVATSAFVGGAAFAVIGGWLIWTSSARGHLP